MIDQSLLDDFSVEARDNCIRAEEALLALETQGTTPDGEMINSLFRALHTIKGTSAFLKLDSIKNLAHAMENIAGKMRDRTIVSDRTIFTVLLKSTDMLKKLISDPSLPLSDALLEELEKLSGTKTEHVCSSTSITQLFNLDAYNIDALQKEQLHLYAFSLATSVDPDLPAKIDSIIQELKLFGKLLDTDPAIEVWKEHRSKGVLNFLFATVIEDADIVTSSIGSAVTACAHLSPKELNKIQATITVPTEPEPKVTKNDSLVPNVQVFEHTVRISVHLLDKLINLASELVLVRNRNLLAVAKNDSNLLQSVSNRLNQVTSDIQTTVMQTRMKPVGTIFTRFTRLVRDLCDTLGKKATLTISDGNVELDKTIIDSIAEPLTHMVRNSIDHGIEQPSVRLAKGKSEAGTIELSASHHAGEVVLKVSDDGKGMDPERIRQIAVKKGVVTPEAAANLSHYEALNLIFEPGFSTAETVTEISGRGVGMDVVRSSFKRLNGTVTIDSIVDKGSTFTIKVPLTLAIIHALIVGIDKNLFAIPQTNIAEVVWLYGADCFQKIKIVDGKEVFYSRGKILPLVRLAEVLEIKKTYGGPQSDKPKTDRRRQRADRRQEIPDNPALREKRTGPADRRTSLDNSLYIIIIHHGDLNYGLVLDAINDTEEIVVKPLHDQLQHARAFSGTTMLGDGKIAMILDIAAIASITGFSQAGRKIAIPRDEGILVAQQNVLIFTIGGTERFAIPLHSIVRVEEVLLSSIHLVAGAEYVTLGNKTLRLIRMERALPKFQAQYNGDTMLMIIPKETRSIGIAVATLINTEECDRALDTTTFVMDGIFGSRIIDNFPVLFPDIKQIISAIDPAWFSLPEDDEACVGAGAPEGKADPHGHE